MSVDDQPDQESIAKLAYLLWESRGRPADSAKQDWSEAEALLAASKAAKAADAKAPGGKISTLKWSGQKRIDASRARKRARVIPANRTAQLLLRFARCADGAVNPSRSCGSCCQVSV